MGFKTSTIEYNYRLNGNEEIYQFKGSVDYPDGSVAGIIDQIVRDHPDHIIDVDSFKLDGYYQNQQKLVRQVINAANIIAKEGRLPKASYIPMSFKQVKLGEIFECEGRLYSIAVPDSASVDTLLDGGRCLIQLKML